MFVSCTLIAISLFLLGSSGNGICILVFLRKKFRYRIITPYFVVLLFADSIYLLFRLTKLLYYFQTLFKTSTKTGVSCSQTFLARLFEHATQNWHQTLVPLIHSETYMRFSLILMSIMSVQRTIFITRSLKLLVLPTTFKDKDKYKWTFLFIIFAFICAYTFECAGLNLFCSNSSNRDMAYDWFIYMNKNMENTTHLLTSAMSNQPEALKCVNYAINNLQKNKTMFTETNSTCTEEKLINILSKSFDLHQKSIVNLIQKIILNQTGDKLSRNEIRRKFHFHECLFPQEPNFFYRYYDFIYSRVFGFNRHTLLLVFGSIIPSLITIASNIISVYRVRELNRLTSTYILPCRRTDDTRRILLVITVECLFAIVNSWFSDIILSLIYCQRRLSAGDDCPTYLKKNFELIIMLDLFNSVSNIVLHCLCGKRFRNELRRMSMSFSNTIKQFFRDMWCCYFQIDCRRQKEEQHISYKASITQHNSSNSSGSVNHNHFYLQIRPSPKLNRKNCCDFRWYFNRRPLIKSKKCLSTISHGYLERRQTPYTIQYRSLTQRTYITKPSSTRSIRLYYPNEQTTATLLNKKRSLNCH